MKTHFILITLIVMASCTITRQNNSDFNKLEGELDEQLKTLVREIPEDRVPRSYPDKNGGYFMVSSKDWTSGFPAGTFWYMYELTNDDFWKQAAVDNTLKLDGVQYLTHTHDLGFMVFCSYGNAYRITGE